jgi:adenine-specific DNA glycosylase
VCTVLGRIFFANPDLQPEQARELARKICPNDPWKLDLALYDIGKFDCLPTSCDYIDCPVGLSDLCEDYTQYKNSNTGNAS